MSEYPRMLYRDGTARRIWGVNVDTLIVADTEAEAKARSEGWRRSPLVEEAQEASAPAAEDEVACLRSQLAVVTEECDQLRIKLDEANDMLADATAPDVKADGAILPQLDHDGDGHPGGSLKGEESTAATGARRKRERVDGSAG